MAEVAAEVAALNPPLTVEELMENVEVDPADPSRVVGDLRGLMRTTGGSGGTCTPRQSCCWATACRRRLAMPL